MLMPNPNPSLSPKEKKKKKREKEKGSLQSFILAVMLLLVLFKPLLNYNFD